MTSTSTSNERVPNLPRPEFVPLKNRGGDPICGLSRSWWYGAEAKGLIRLVRLRKPGQVRGRVLLPVPQAIELLHRLGHEAAKGTDGNV